MTLTIIIAYKPKISLNIMNGTCIQNTFTFATFWLYYFKGVPTVSVLQSSYSVSPGNTVILQCLINSTLPVTYVYWERYIEGITKIISFTTDTNKYSGSTSTTPSLTIFHASQSDAGNYKCFANNGVGKGHSTTTSMSIAGSKYICCYIT